MLAGGEAANVSRHHHAPMPMGPGNECRDDSGVCAISERSPFSTGSKKPRPSARVPDDYSSASAEFRKNIVPVYALVLASANAPLPSADQGNRPCSSGRASTAATRRYALTQGAAGVRVSTSAPASPSSTVSERSEEHTSELQSLMRISYAVFCLK